MMPLTRDAQLRFAQLVCALLEGRISEREFMKVGLDGGLSLERLNEALNELKELDGVR